MITVKCPKCAEMVEVDEERRAGRGKLRLACKQCGTRFAMRINRPSLKVEGDAVAAAQVEEVASEERKPRRAPRRKDAHRPAEITDPSPTPGDERTQISYSSATEGPDVPVYPSAGSGSGGDAPDSGDGEDVVVGDSGDDDSAASGHPGEVEVNAGDTAETPAVPELEGEGDGEEPRDGVDAAAGAVDTEGGEDGEDGEEEPQGEPQPIVDDPHAVVIEDVTPGAGLDPLREVLRETAPFLAEPHRLGDVGRKMPNVITNLTAEQTEAIKAELGKVPALFSAGHEREVLVGQLLPYRVGPEDPTPDPADPSIKEVRQPRPRHRFEAEITFPEEEASLSHYRGRVVADDVLEMPGDSDVEEDSESFEFHISEDDDGREDIGPDSGDSEPSPADFSVEQEAVTVPDAGPAGGLGEVPSGDGELGEPLQELAPAPEIPDPEPEPSEVFPPILGEPGDLGGPDTPRSLPEASHPDPAEISRAPAEAPQTQVPPKILVSNLQEVPGHEVEVLGMVTHQFARKGGGEDAEARRRVRTFGGRYRRALEDLARQANDMGGDTVIGVEVLVQPTGEGDGMVWVLVQGTACRRSRI